MVSPKHAQTCAIETYILHIHFHHFHHRSLQHYAPIPFFSLQSNLPEPKTNQRYEVTLSSSKHLEQRILISKEFKVAKTKLKNKFKKIVKDSISISYKGRCNTSTVKNILLNCLPYQTQTWHTATA